MRQSNIPRTTWGSRAAKKEHPSFSGTFMTDAVVVGGGLAGMLSAYLLAKAGKKVALLEKEEIGGGMTARTTAFLTSSIDTDTPDLISSFGKRKAKEIISSHEQAINLIEKIIKKENIDCEFMRVPNYVYVNAHKDIHLLEEEVEALRSLGFEAEMNKSGFLGFPNAGYLETKEQAKFHPLKFLYGLAEAAERMGVQIFEHTEAVGVEQANFYEKVTTVRGAIHAKAVVIATYHPFDNHPRLYFKKGTYLSYVMELEVRNMRLKEGIFEDVENPYHYLRVDRSSRGYRVILGGEDHRADVPVNENKNWNALMEYAKWIFPEKNFSLKRRWIGEILEPIDGIPYIGRIDKRNAVYIFGFSGNGMTYSAIAAVIARDIIMKKKNPWIQIYSPRRKVISRALMVKGMDYAEEFIGGAVKNTFGQSKKKKF